MNVLKNTIVAIGLGMSVVACASRMAPITLGPASDQTIKTHVQTLLLNEPNVHAREITVDVAQGVVTLRGSVHGDQEASAAVAAARRADGVKDVKSELQPTQ